MKKIEQSCIRWAVRPTLQSNSSNCLVLMPQDNWVIWDMKCRRTVYRQSSRSHFKEAFLETRPKIDGFMKQPISNDQRRIHSDFRVAFHETSDQCI